MYRRSLKADKVIQVRHALSKVKKAISNTKTQLSVVGPVRTRQFVKALNDCCNKVELAAENEIQVNLELRTELEWQRGRIAELERDVGNLSEEIQEEKRQRESKSNSLQEQIDEINKELDYRAATEEILMNNIKDALEAALNVYHMYGRNNNYDDINDNAMQ